MTSQDLYASDVGLAVALELANLARSGGGQSELRAVFASDPVSVESVDDAEADQFLELAQQSATIAGLLATNTERDTDHAVEILNQLLEIFPAQLHLTKQELGWTLHHHRRDAPLVPAWSAVVAGAFARVIGYGRQARVGSCQASDCDRYFYDLSKNNSRRYCSLACQNRTKAAAHRARRKG